MKHKFNALFFPHDHKPEHFKSLDGLRGIAVIFVLLSHSSNANLFFLDVLNFQKIGKIGVYLFFVLSAYLLDRQIALAYMAGKSSKLYWKNYFLRRFLRIYPLFVIALVLHGLFTFLGTPTVIDSLKDIGLHMLLLKGESIFWSIPVEFKYYFISPLIMWFCHCFLHWNATKLLVLFILLITISILIALEFNLSTVSTLRYFPIFLVGTLLSIYELISKKMIVHNINPKLFNVLGVLAMIMIMLTVPYFFKHVFGTTIDFHSVSFYFPYAILWGMMLLSVKYGKGIMRCILELKFLRFIGTISFSIYLFHMLILKLVLQVNLHSNAKIYLFFLLTILFSSLSFLILERPLSKIRLYKKTITEKDLKR